MHDHFQIHSQMLVFRRLCSSSMRGSTHYGGRGSVWRPAVFTLLVGGVSYTASGVYAAEQKLSQMSRNRLLYLNDDLLSKIKRWWWNIGAVNRFSITMISLNSLVFLLWRVAPMYRLMDKYFISSISSKSSLPLLLSAFSHTEVWHLGLNMLVLWSFTPALMRTLEEMDSSISSWPYYLTGGTFASMVGYYSKVFKKLPIGSLGASGALMAVVSMVVFNNPDSVVYLIFLPFVPIPASWALGGVVALDAIGVIRGWQFFDHAGHLGGVLFAVLYQWWLHKVCSNIHLKSAVGWFKARSKTNS